MKRKTLDTELAHLDREIGRSIIAAVTGPPPTRLGTRILAARGVVTASMRLGDPVRPETLAFACRPMPEDPDAIPWRPPASPVARRRWWQRRR